MVPKNKIRRSRKGKKSSVAAFFDIDNTLLEVNSARLYFKYFYDQKKISFPQLMKMGFWTALHRINLLKEEKALPKALNIVIGWEEKEAKMLVDEAFEALVKERLNPEMLDQLEDHRSKNHHIVLVTAAPLITATPIFAYVDADHLMASMFEIKNKRYTGECLHLMYGQGKINPVMQYAKEHKINLSKSYAYADSYTDRVIMELVGNPIAVNPDKKLKSHAKKHGWKIIKH